MGAQGFHFHGAAIQIPRAERVEIAHEHVGPVAVAPQPGARHPQLQGTRLLVGVVQMGDIGRERLAVGQENAPLQQPALLLGGEQPLGSSSLDVR